MRYLRLLNAVIQTSIFCDKSKFKNADEESGEKSMLYLNLSVLNPKKNLEWY